MQKEFTNEANKVEGDFVREGRSVGYASPADARFSDFFTGDEVGAFTRIELAKLQMFFFTVIVIFVYAVTLAGMFVTMTKLEALPVLTEGIVLFLAISHAGYVADKAVPSMPSGATPPPDPPSNPNEDK